MGKHFSDYDLTARHALAWISEEAVKAIQHSCEITSFIREPRGSIPREYHVARVMEAIERVRELSDIVESHMLSAASQEAQS